ncbi:calcium-binding protein [Methylobacterium trifolii]
MVASSPTGTRYDISDVDLGILQDLGAPIATQRNDVVTLGTLNDTFLAFGGNDTVSGGGGNDVLFGNQGDDVLFGNLGNDTLFGGQDRDTVYGGQNDDAVLGNLGDDVVLGNLGNDTLFGGQGADTLYGGQGNDLLFGDLGNDVLSGDLGADRYVFGQNSGIDLVVGFSQAQGDRLDLSGQSYTLGSAASGNALLTLSGGGTVELAGVQAGGVNASFFA